MFYANAVNCDHLISKIAQSPRQETDSLIHVGHVHVVTPNEPPFYPQRHSCEKRYQTLRFQGGSGYEASQFPANRLSGN